MSDTEPTFPDRIYRNLLLLSAGINACLTAGSKAVCDNGLTEAQLNAVRFLYMKRDLVMRDVATGLNFSFAAGTKTIDRLAQKGLAQRVPREEDGRQVHVTLTDKGEELASRLKEGTEGAFRRVLSSMPGEEIHALNTSIENFLSGIIRDAESADHLCVACGYENGLDCRSRGGDCLVKEAMVSALDEPQVQVGESTAVTR